MQLRYSRVCDALLGVRAEANDIGHLIPSHLTEKCQNCNEKEPGYNIVLLKRT